MKLTKLFFIMMAILIITGCNNRLQPDNISNITITDTNNNVINLTKEEKNEFIKALNGEPVNYGLKSPQLTFLLQYDESGKTKEAIFQFDIIDKKATSSTSKGIIEVPFNLIKYFSKDIARYGFVSKNSCRIDVNLNDKNINTSYDKKVYMDFDGEDTLISQRSNSDNSVNMTELSKISLLINDTNNTIDSYEVTLTNSDTNSEISKTYDGSTINNIILPDKAGNYTYNILAKWNNEITKGEQMINFNLQVMEKEKIVLASDEYRQGDLMVLLIKNYKDLDYRLETEHFKNTIGLFYYEDNLIALIPITSTTEPKEYQLNLYRGNSNKPILSTSYNVVKRDFEVQHLKIDNSFSKLKTPDKSKSDTEKMMEARSYSEPTALFEGKFIVPIIGRVSTSFQAIRFTNGSLSSYRHSGMDISAPLGTKIKATNNGIVTMADEIFSGGNTIVIDHGYGLFSQYMHLDKIYVEKGDNVKKGEYIGEVGTTGFSTGPHLHFDMYKNGVFVDPMQMVNNDILAPFDEE